VTFVEENCGSPAEVDNVLLLSVAGTVIAELGWKAATERWAFRSIFSRDLTRERSRARASLAALFDSCSSTTTFSKDRHVSSSLAR
jgi:hypothetical protein